MNRLRLALLTLALGTALIGCAEKKDTAQKPKEAVSAPAEVAAQKPVEPVPAAPVPEKTEVKTEAVSPAVEKVKSAEKAVEAKAAAAVKAVEKKAVQVEKALVSAAPALDAAAGAEIYKKKCAPCHGGEGKGTTMAPALKGNEWVRVASVGDITGVIRNGRQANEKKYPKFFSPMPASKTMSEDDLGSLAAYLKSLN